MVYDRANEYSERIMEYSKDIIDSGFLKLLNADSRNLTMLENESVDIIITSPPYANTYDYYLYHKFRKRWLDLDVHFAQYNEIGSRREYSSLKKPANQWTIDFSNNIIKIQKKPHLNWNPRTKHQSGLYLFYSS